MTKRRMHERSSSAYDLFVRFHTNKFLALKRSTTTSKADDASLTSERAFNAAAAADDDHYFSITTTAPSSSSRASFRMKRDLFKSYVQRFLGDAPRRLLDDDDDDTALSSSSPNLTNIEGNIRQRWKAADESTKSVFEELANEEGGGGGSGGGGDTHGIVWIAESSSAASSSSSFHKQQQQQQQQMIHCPIVHIPNRPNVKRSKRRLPPREEDYNNPNNIINNSNDDDERCATVNRNPPALVELTGIISFIDEKDDDNVIGPDELRAFLLELDWDK